MEKTLAKERPILFSGAMVRAILEGRKTQTRRVVKPQPIGPGPSHWYQHPTEGWWTCGDNTGTVWKCPYGGVGDRMWVRETWTPDHAAFYPHLRVIYRADGMVDDSEIEDGKIFSPEARRSYSFRWRPSIHMPRGFCRLHLQISDVRVERLKAISEYDARAEGVNVREPGRPDVGYLCAKDAYEVLWGQINGPGSWDANPWVWALTFKEVGAS